MAISQLFLPMLDACAETPAGETVDAVGCSHAEFCASVDTLRAVELMRVCPRLDWMHDEPAKRNPRDCKAAGKWFWFFPFDVECRPNDS